MRTCDICTCVKFRNSMNYLNDWLVRNKLIGIELCDSHEYEITKNLEQLEAETQINLKLEIANELLKNTSNDYLKVFISNYILIMEELENGYDGDKDLIRFHNCISYIVKEKFDITGWMLFEIPIFYCHCFWNTQTKKSFDLTVWDIGKVIPKYLDSEANENLLKLFKKQ